MKRTFLAVIVLVLALAGCSGSSEASSEEMQLSSLKSYFEALSKDQTEAMMNSASPDTAAATYAQWMKNYTDAYEFTDSTDALEEVSLEKVVLKSDDEVTTFKDFTFGADQKLSSWTSDPGGPLEGRINDTQKEFIVKPVVGTVLEQYLNNSGTLVVTMTIRNKSAEKTSLSPRAYVNPDGKQNDASIWAGNSSGGVTVLEAKAYTNAFIEVKKGKMGGKLSLYTYDKKGHTQSEVIVSLPK